LQNASEIINLNINNALCKVYPDLVYNDIAEERKSKKTNSTGFENIYNRWYYPRGVLTRRGGAQLLCGFI
jgi:hypothetical protein